MGEKSIQLYLFERSVVGTGSGSWIILFISLIYCLGKKDTDLTSSYKASHSLSYPLCLDHVLLRLVHVFWLYYYQVLPLIGTASALREFEESVDIRWY